VTKNLVLIDVSTAGAGGDMFLSALTDLIGEDNALLPVAASLLIYDPTFRLNVVPCSFGEHNGKKLHITRNPNIRFNPASLSEVLASVAEEVELSPAARSLAEKALQEIFEAESRAHDKPIKELHLHETGSIDTILDIAGTAYLLDRAGLLEDTEIVSTHVAVGSGTIKTEHGDLEVPVPAVAEIIVANDIPFHSGDAKTEVLTPTGAAILAAITSRFVESQEGFVVKKQGLGFGNRDLGEIPNAMKIALVEMVVPEETAPKKPTPSAESKKVASKSEESVGKEEDSKTGFDEWSSDEVVVIETNVDDVDGETLGNLFDTVLEQGLAYDVVIIPAIGKKNRPCFVVKVIAAKAGLKSIAEIMIRHLGTIGIRYTPWKRLKASRETIVCSLKIDDVEHMIRVKVSRTRDGSIINIKPEADDLLKVSKATGIPVRELRPRIALQAHAITE